METVILVMRHGDVENPGEIVYGRRPGFGLSESGRKQVEKVAWGLASTRLEAIYTSPLLRARQTATLMAVPQPGVPIRVSRLLLEVRTSWEGEPSSAIPMEPHPFNYYEPPRHQDDELPSHQKARMCRFVDRVRRKHPGGTVLAVSHGDPIACLRLAMLGHEPTLAGLRSELYPLRASITKLTFAGEAVQVDYIPPL